MTQEAMQKISLMPDSYLGGTLCPRSLANFYISGILKEMDENFWTYSNQTFPIRPTSIVNYFSPMNSFSLFSYNFLVFIGKPMYFMEAALGQFAQVAF